MLNLPIEFMEDALIWDAAHRLELVHHDVKHGKKDHSGNILIHPTLWLQNLDKTLQSIMTNFRTGQSHSNLRAVAQEMGEPFLEFCLFSETRFMEYSHRTYDHFIKMFHILYEKIKRDECKSENPSDTAHNLHKMLVLAETVTDLVFMKELSQLQILCESSMYCHLK